MSSPLDQFIADLASADVSKRLAAASEIYGLGRARAGSAISQWWAESELSALLLGPKPEITVGLAVQRDTFGRIRIASGTPRLADVPPDQDAEEFELHFADGLLLDILTTRVGSHREVSGQVWRGRATGGISLRKCGSRYANTEREIRNRTCLSFYAEWGGWHASQFFPRRISGWGQSAHRIVRIANSRIDFRRRLSSTSSSCRFFSPG